MGRAGTTRVLVATIAFGLGVNKPDIRFIVHYQPSRSLEAYAQEAGRAGRDGRAAHCVLFATPADKGTLTRRAHEDRLPVQALRDLYRRLRAALTASGGGPVAMRDLHLGVDESDQADADLRVGLSLLERAGFLRRGLDVPGEVTISLARAPGVPEERAFIAALGLDAARPRVLKGAQAAAALGCPVEQLEALLADRDEAGLITFTSRRSRLHLTLIQPAPADGAQRLDDLLGSMDSAAVGRAQALAGYIDAQGCRNQAIARHFQVPAPAPCGHCDNCLPAGRRATLRVSTAVAAPRVEGLGPREAVLRLVQELPFAAGRSGLSRILAGASSAPIAPNRCRLFGALAGRTQVAIIAEIDGLREEGLLVVSEAGGRPCLVLTDAGRAALAS